MKFSIASVIAALAASVAAVPAFTNSKFDVTAGSTFTLTWANATGPVTVNLLTGPSNDLTKVETLTSATSATSYTWNVPTTLASGEYAFAIADSTGINYSVQFPLTGSGTSSSAAASSASSTAASSSSSAASSASSSSSSESASSSESVSSSETASSASSASSESASLTSSAASSSLTAHTTSNSTSTATKTTKTSTKSSSTATSTSTSAITNTNSGYQAKSPLAFVLVTFAALLYLN